VVNERGREREIFLPLKFHEKDEISEKLRFWRFEQFLMQLMDYTQKSTLEIFFSWPHTLSSPILTDRGDREISDFLFKPDHTYAFHKKDSV